MPLQNTEPVHKNPVLYDALLMHAQELTIDGHIELLTVWLSKQLWLLRTLQ